MTRGISASALHAARRTLRQWVTGTFSGRALAAGALIKLAAFFIRIAAGPSPAAEAVDTVGDVSLVAGAAALAYRLFVDLKRVVLWRVRRKLTLSYIFIGFVPVLLVITFFVLSGLLLFFNIGSYLLRSRVMALAEQAHFLADSTSLELQRTADAELRETLERRQLGASSRFPNASYALVPADRTCDGAPDTAERGSISEGISAGRWAHVDPPAALPAWVPCAGAQGLLAYREGPGGVTRLAVRAIALPGVRSPRYAVVVDVPIGETLARQLRAETGIQVGGLTAIEGASDDAVPMVGRAVGGDPPGDMRFRIFVGPANIIMDEAAGPAEFEWVTLLDFTDWSSGRAGTMAVSFQMSPVDTYRRISVTSLTRVSDLDFGQIVLILLAVVGGLFLVIQIVAFVMGLALARSITGSVHELFAGTERVRRGDFSHKIAIRSRDQLGELADSFNSMTASIDDLLRQKAEKERLEQELRIARAIQMSLLPQGGLTIPGLALTAHCEPAREVGGDYYDYLPIDERRIALLIADVSGKGTSAALYMAVLKGIVLSLARLHASPRRLLMDANRIIARHLDTRSFITVTYAVVDLDARTLTYARAGHCPLIHVPGPHAPSRVATVHAPDGLVLGLQIDDGETFDRLLEEVTLPLGPGDVFLFYTDGITEAANPAGEFFGEARLGRLLQDQSDLPFEQLQESILREVRAFAGPVAQQDDMTLLLLKVQDTGEAAAL